MDEIKIKPIARIRSDFPSKFGIPRQSGVVNGLISYIVFENRYRNDDALRGLEGFSHIWLIWGFSASAPYNGNMTVRPPRLGGNVRLGVFATRSPNRPNPLGLSCVALEGAEHVSGHGTVLRVSGADLMDGTPIYDIKPYLPLSDCRPEAAAGFAAATAGQRLRVEAGDDLLALLPPEKRAALLAVLAEDPRPAYHNDPQREYGFPFAGFEIKFTSDGKTLKLTSVKKL